MYPQENIDWAMYSGMVMVCSAFIISIVAPNVRGFFKGLVPAYISKRFRLVQLLEHLFLIKKSGVFAEGRISGYN